MAEDASTKKMILAVVVAFALLVGLFLWWKSPGTRQTDQPNQPQFQMGEENTQQSDSGNITGEYLSQADQEEQVKRKELARYLKDVRPPTDRAQRRTAAWHLMYMAQKARHDPELADLMRNQGTQGVLLNALKDTDPRVADRCAAALLDLWSSSESVVARRLLARAIESYEHGQLDQALNRLDRAAQFDDAIPELYRLRAEVWLKKQRLENALQDARKATRMQSKHFRAYYTIARCHLRNGNEQQAAEAISRALEIYRHFEDARELQEKLEARQQQEDA
jgi:tetratricopeptide (TPR) repeat protein